MIIKEPRLIVFKMSSYDNQKGIASQCIKQGLHSRSPQIKVYPKYS